MSRYQLPGVQQLSRTSPLLPVFVAGGLLVAVLAGSYFWPRVTAASSAGDGRGSAQAGSVVAAAAPAQTPPPPTPAVPTTAAQTAAQDTSDLQHHLDVGRAELLRSTEELVRAERAWTVVAARINRNYLTEERRRADDGTDAARSARRAVERAIVELDIARQHIK